MEVEVKVNEYKDLKVEIKCGDTHFCFSYSATIL